MKQDIMHSVMDRHIDPRRRFLSRDDAQDLIRRIQQYAVGGGYAGVWFRSQWTGNVRWARNLVSSTGDTENNSFVLMRDIRGAENPRVMINELTDVAVVSALRETERLLQFDTERPDAELAKHIQTEPATDPALFFDSTYHVTAATRAQLARDLSRSAADAGMLSSGYIEMMARSEAFLTTWGITQYTQYTWARYSVTVRDPKGTSSGWAGVDWPDWTRIDAPTLSQRALDKCLSSRNPARVEPGRYTTILEPQAVSDLVQMLMGSFVLGNYTQGEASFNKRPGNPYAVPPDRGAAKLGERVVDERITISADPLDPDLGVPPAQYWLINGDPWSLIARPTFHPVTWIKDGVLSSLEYGRYDAVFTFGQNLGQPDSRSFRISVTGPRVSVDEMIATTKRGLLVTRFDQVMRAEFGPSVLCRGYTRDGLWLVEDGKVTKPAVNMMFTESPLFVLNNIEQLGEPTRTYNPMGVYLHNNPTPAIVPPMKVRDFSFTALSDAV